MDNDAPEQQGGASGDFVSRIETELLRTRKVLIFGDIHDPESDVSRAIRERGGYQLMPEWDTKPSNHYLPRVKTEPSCGCGKSGGCGGGATTAEGSFEARFERGEVDLAALAVQR